MNGPIKSSRHQDGQVVIIVAICILLLIMIIGLVVDLGYLYTRKTELQNAADAAALAGAKELNGTASGIDNAVTQAIALAAANSVDFGGNPISQLTAANIWFANTPDGNDTNNDGIADAAWSTPAEAQAAPKNKFFVKVDTSGIGLSTVQTWFMVVAGPAFEETGTYGMAVAGTYAAEISPLAACALDGSATAPCLTNDCGYASGKAYPLSKVNPIGPGTIFWIDPVATTAGQCDGDVPSTLPFVCQGKVSAAVAIANQVYTNTGFSTPQLEALDSRFGSYAPQGKCDPATAPPDLNVKEYRYTNSDIAAWMSPQPTQQSSQVLGKTGTPPVIGTDYNGVVWSFVTPPAGIPEGNSFSSGRTVVAGNYPASGTPYSNRSDSRFYAPPTGMTGVFERRVLNLLIVACPSAGGVCRPANVLGVGRFLLQRKANVPSDKEIYLEFGGMTFAGPPLSEIRLYR